MTLRGTMDACDVNGIKQQFSCEVSRRKEVVPVFFEIIRSTLKTYKGFKTVALTRNQVLTILKHLDNRRSLHNAGFHRHDFFKMSEIPEYDLWEAVLYCASLGECFVINNSFFPVASFVRSQLADIFTKEYVKDTSKEFIAQVNASFEVVAAGAASAPSTPGQLNITNAKIFGRQLWVKNPSTMRVFTREIAKCLKHWKDIENDAIIWRDCAQFFEDCGVLVPFFAHEEGAGSSSVQLQWHIAHTSVGSKQDKPEIQDDSQTMHAFYVLNVSPLSLITRCWTSFVGMRNGTAHEAEELLTFTNTENTIDVKRDWGSCRLILQDFPCFNIECQEENDRCDIRMLTKGLQENTQTELSAKAAAMLHLCCSKRDSALFRFCVEGVEEVLQSWYPDFRQDIFMSCYVPDDLNSQHYRVYVPLLPIFDQNANKSLAGDRHLPPAKLFPRTCSIFLSHAYEGDGTSQFTDMLKEFIERRFICSVWYDKSNMDEASEFKKEMQTGLSVASSIIICLTPLYMTRPNCLRELKWALDLRDHHAKSSKGGPPIPKICVLALHPSMTFAGRQTVLKHRCVFLPKSQDNATPRSEDQVIAHMLSEHAIQLLAKLDDRGIYNDFIDAMPWRSDFEDWSHDVPELDLSFSEHAPVSVADFFQNSTSKSVRELLTTFSASSTAPDFKNSPLDLSSPAFLRGFEFVDLKTEELHSTPKTRQSAELDQLHAVDTAGI